jgi:hypothetical protein
MLPLSSRRKKLFFWGSLVVLIVLYSLYYVFFLYGISLNMPLRGRHILKFLFIVAVYGAGAVGLHGFGMPWMKRVWHVTYLTILVLLVGLGAFDWLVARTPLEVRAVADSLQEFLVSPLLYVVMRILN